MSENKKHPQWCNFTLTSDIGEGFKEYSAYHKCYLDWYQEKSERSRLITVVSLLLAILYLALGFLYGGGNIFSNHTIFSKYTAIVVFFLVFILSLTHFSFYKLKEIPIFKSHVNSSFIGCGDFLYRHAFYCLCVVYVFLMVFPVLLLFFDSISIVNSLIPIGVFLLVKSIYSYAINKFEGFTRATYRHRYYHDMLQTIKYRKEIKAIDEKIFSEMFFALVSDEVTVRNSDVLKDFDHYSHRLTGAE